MAKYDAKYYVSSHTAHKREQLNQPHKPGTLVLCHLADQKEKNMLHNNDNGRLPDRGKPH